MAYKTETIGKFSELIAMASLMANGWQAVGKPETEEAFDISARDPLGKFVTFQVKTMKIRGDRKGELVVQTRNGKGRGYSPAEVDYIIGVLGADGEKPRVWMFENTGQQEYWASEQTAAKRWVELGLTLNRDLFDVTTIETEAV
jgi:hypothetical protein